MTKEYVAAAQWFRATLDLLDRGEPSPMKREEIKKYIIWADYKVSVMLLLDHVICVSW